MDTQATFADFVKLNMRVGKILEVTEPSGSQHLWRFKVDLGKKLGKRTILAGMKTFYSKEELEGQTVVVVANLESKKMMGEDSQGMILAADVDGKPVLVAPISDAPVGSQVR